ncbi:MAG: hypothetical protein NTU73_09120 [Ignavibacteriae bacterium]|nr:hypothetical protein [Ignavibacteriota bacterium]
MRFVTRGYKITLITSEDVKAHLIPNLKSFNIGKIAFTNLKILKDKDLIECVEIKLIMSLHIFNEVVNYLEDYYTGKFDVSYYFEEVQYY